MEEDFNFEIYEDEIFKLYQEGNYDYVKILIKPLYLLELRELEILYQIVANVNFEIPDYMDRIISKIIPSSIKRKKEIFKRFKTNKTPIISTEYYEIIENDTDQINLIFDHMFKRINDPRIDYRLNERQVSIIKNINDDINSVSLEDMLYIYHNRLDYNYIDLAALKKIIEDKVLVEEEKKKEIPEINKEYLERKKQERIESERRNLLNMLDTIEHIISQYPVIQFENLYSQKLKIYIENYNLLFKLKELFFKEKVLLLYNKDLEESFYRVEKMVNYKIADYENDLMSILFLIENTNDVYTKYIYKSNYLRPYSGPKGDIYIAMNSIVNNLISTSITRSELSLINNKVNFLKKVTDSANIISSNYNLEMTVDNMPQSSQFSNQKNYQIFEKMINISKADFEYVRISIISSSSMNSLYYLNDNNLIYRVNNYYKSRYHFNYSILVEKMNRLIKISNFKYKPCMYFNLPYFIEYLRIQNLKHILIYRYISDNEIYYEYISESLTENAQTIYIELKDRMRFSVSTSIPSRYPKEFREGSLKNYFKVKDLAFKSLLCYSSYGYIDIDNYLNILPHFYYYKEKMRDELISTVYHVRHNRLLSYLSSHLKSIYYDFTFISDESLFEDFITIANLQGEYNEIERNLSPDIMAFRYSQDINKLDLLILEFGVSSEADQYMKEKIEKYKPLIKDIQDKESQHYSVNIQYGAVIFNTVSYHYNVNPEYYEEYKKYLQSYYLFKNVHKRQLLNKDLPRTEYTKIVTMINTIKSIFNIYMLYTTDFVNQDFIDEQIIKQNEKVELFLEEELKIQTINVDNNIREDELLLETPYNIVNKIIRDIKEDEETRLQVENIVSLISRNLEKTDIMSRMKYQEPIERSENDIKEDYNDLDNYLKTISFNCIEKSLKSKYKGIESLLYIPISFSNLFFKSGTNNIKLQETFSRIFKMIYNKEDEIILCKSSQSQMTFKIFYDYISRMISLYDEAYANGNVQDNLYEVNDEFYTLLFSKKDKTVNQRVEDRSSLSLQNIQEIESFFDQLSKIDLYSNSNILNNLTQLYQDKRNHLYYQYDYINKFKEMYTKLSNVSKNIIQIANNYYISSFQIDYCMNTFRKRYNCHSFYQSGIINIINKGLIKSSDDDYIKTISIGVLKKEDFKFLILPFFSIDSYMIIDDYVIYITNTHTINTVTISQMKNLLSQILSTIVYVYDLYPNIDYINDLIKIIFCSNRLNKPIGCKFLSEVRYLISILSTGNFRIKNLIEKRFPKYIDSYPLLYLFNKFIKNIKSNLINKNSEYYKTQFYGDMYKIISYGAFSGWKIENMDLILVEQYMTKYTSKYHKSLFHAKVETLKTIKEYQKDDHYMYDEELIFEVGRLVKKYVSKDINNMILQAADELLIDNCKSSSTYHTKISEDYTRTHLTDAILDYIHNDPDNKIRHLNEPNYDCTLADVLMKCKQQYIPILASVKPETKGYRETNVTNLETLCGLKIIEKSSQNLNEYIGIDDICRDGDSKFVKYQDLVQNIYSKVNNEKYCPLRSSNDGQKWSTGDNIDTELATYAALFTDKSFEELKKFKENIKYKNINICKNLTERLLWIIYAISWRHLIGQSNIYTINGKEYKSVSAVEKVFGKSEVELNSGWPEGFFNSLSSLKHSLSYIACSLYIYSTHCVEKNNKIYFSFSVHSDDSFHAILSKDSSYLKDLDLKVNKIKCMFQVITNLTKDIITLKIYDIQEYLSNFNILNSIIPAKIIHGISMYKDLSGISYSSDSKSLSGKLLEGLRYNLGNNWYQISIRLGNNYLSRCFRVIDHMKNLITGDQPRDLMPEEFFGYFYAIPSYLLAFKTKASHIRLIEMNCCLNLILNIYTENGQLTEPTSISPKIHIKSRNKRIIRSIIPEYRTIKEKYKKFNEDVLPLLLEGDLSSREKFEIIVCQVLSNSGKLAYQSNKSYSYKTSRVSYNSFKFRGIKFVDFYTLIKSFSTIRVSNPLDYILSSNIDYYPIYKQLNNYFYVKENAQKFEYKVSKIYALNLFINQKDLKFSKLIQYKRLNLKEIKTLLEIDLKREVTSSFTYKYIRNLKEKILYAYIDIPNINLETDIISNYMNFNVNFPNYYYPVHDLSSITIRNKEDKEINLTKLNIWQSEDLVYSFMNYLSYIYLLDIYIQYIPTIAQLKEYIEDFIKRYTRGLSSSINFLYKEIHKYLNRAQKDIYKGKVLACLNFLEDIYSPKDLVENLSDVIYKYDDNYIYIIYMDKLTDQQLFLRNDKVCHIGFPYKLLDYYKERGKIVPEKNYRLQLSEKQVKTIMCMYGIKERDVNLLTEDQIINNFITNYLSLYQIDQNLKVRARDYTEKNESVLCIYKENMYYYLGKLERYSEIPKFILEENKQMIMRVNIEECKAIDIQTEICKNMKIDTCLVDKIICIRKQLGIKYYYSNPYFFGNISKVPVSLDILEYFKNKVVDIDLLGELHVTNDLLLFVLSLKVKKKAILNIPILDIADLLESEKFNISPKETNWLNETFDKFKINFLNKYKEKYNFKNLEKYLKIEEQEDNSKEDNNFDNFDVEIEEQSLNIGEDMLNEEFESDPASSSAQYKEVRRYLSTYILPLKDIYIGNILFFSKFYNKLYLYNKAKLNFILHILIYYTKYKENNFKYKLMCLMTYILCNDETDITLCRVSDIDTQNIIKDMFNELNLNYNDFLNRLDIPENQYENFFSNRYTLKERSPGIYGLDINFENNLNQEEQQINNNQVDLDDFLGDDYGNDDSKNNDDEEVEENKEDNSNNNEGNELNNKSNDNNVNIQENM